jgi:hypothetical protein
VERETAVALANEWHDLVRDDKALDAQYDSLISALTELLPAAVESAAVVNGTPSVIACNQAAVYVIGFAPSDNGQFGIQFAREPAGGRRLDFRVRRLRQRAHGRDPALAFRVAERRPGRVHRRHRPERPVGERPG